MYVARALHQIKGSYAFLERNFNLCRRYLGWEIVFLVYTTVNTFAFGLIGKMIGGDSSDYVLYLVIGALMWTFLSALFHEVAFTITWERWEGTLEYTFMAPVHRLTHLIGVCMFAIIYGLIRSILILIAAVFFFELDLVGANLFGGMVIIAASCLPFIGLGLAAAVLPLLSPEKGAQTTQIIQGIILLVSGVYYGVDKLPEWMQPLSYASPATYTLLGVRSSLLEGTPTTELLPYVWWLIYSGIILIPIGYLIFLAGERYAKRHGKLKRSG
jgi:ABC-2 type transport system permease protein